MPTKKIDEIHQPTLSDMKKRIEELSELSDLELTNEKRKTEARKLDITVRVLNKLIDDKIKEKAEQTKKEQHDRKLRGLKNEQIKDKPIQYELNANEDKCYRAAQEEQNDIIVWKVCKDYNKNYHYVRCGKEMKVIWFYPTHVGIGRERRSWLVMAKMTLNGFHDSRKNDTVELLKLNKSTGYLELQKEPKSQIWINSKYLLIYRSGLVFDPPQYCQKDQFNLWHGLNIKPKQGDWSLIHDHILTVICDGNKEYLDYFLDWVADLYQNPFHKLGVAIALMSKEKGTGKNTLIEIIAKPIMDYYIYLNTTKQLLGDFNSHLNGKLLVCADEAIWGGDKKAEGALLSLISETLMPSEAKFEDITAIANYSRIMINTNHGWAIPAGDYERRFLVLKVSPCKIGDRPYFDALRKQAYENRGIEAMLHDLLKRKIVIDHLRKPPITQALLEQYLYNMDEVDVYLSDCFKSESFINTKPIEDEKGHLIGYEAINWLDFEKTTITRIDLYEGFRRYCKDLNKRHIDSHTIFGSKLTKRLPSIRMSREGSGDRKPTYIIPELSKAKKEYFKNIGFESLLKSKNTKVKTNDSYPIEKKTITTQSDQQEDDNLKFDQSLEYVCHDLAIEPETLKANISNLPLSEQNKIKKNPSLMQDKARELNKELLKRCLIG